ncbi:MAG: DUF2218 domain-containing protein [Pseudomonadota bacterium]
MQSLATFTTIDAQHYLETLCRHFSRKIETHCGAGRGWVEFPFGRCEMTADPTHLELLACAEDAIKLAEVVDVVTRHLERYAFRENPRLEWHPNGTSWAQSDE